MTVRDRKARWKGTLQAEIWGWVGVGVRGEGAIHKAEKGPPRSRTEGRMGSGWGARTQGMSGLTGHHVLWGDQIMWAYYSREEFG